MKAMRLRPMRTEQEVRDEIALFEATLASLSPDDDKARTSLESAISTLGWILGEPR